MPQVRRSLWPWILAPLIFSAGAPAGAATPKAPDGFRVRLVSEYPKVQYPSQVATAPDGSLFVAQDPMDQAGPADQPIDSILLFRPGQEEPTIFAEGLNAVFGMFWLDDALYVMNMPKLTVLRDLDGDGKADTRKDLFTDLGVPPGHPNMLNDHIVSGIQLGIDGRLYISTGDKGVPKATGPDGRTVQLRGGGILRCRPDGTELEVYSSGTRNHLEPNLDARDNLFTYDNTDDGLGWWTRVTHHVDGGYYGYPYDYHDRTDRMLPRMAEYGGGSPAGGVAYNEDAWPEKYRGMVFWAEWGKRTVRAFRFEPDGASFQVAEAIDFLTPGEVEDFRPVDLALSYDGKTLYVADWAFGGWSSKTAKVGRLYAVTYEGPEPTTPRPRGSNADPTAALIASLNHPSLNERKRAQAELIKRGIGVWNDATAALAAPQTPALAKRHLVWTVAAIVEAGQRGTAPIAQALKDPSADIRAQAARAFGLARERDPETASALVPLLNDPEPSTRLQAIIAMGRIGDSQAVEPLIPSVAEPDVFLSHSARAALVRIGDWPEIAKGLDSDDPKVRAGVLLTLERIYDPKATGALLAFAESADRDSTERAAAVSYLASACRKAPDWDGQWWGIRPAMGKGPAKTIDWSETPLIREAVEKFLSDPAPEVRVASAGALSEIGAEGAAARIRELFQKETDPQVRSAFARMFGSVRDVKALPLLAEALRDHHAPAPVRDAAFEAVRAIGGPDAASILLEILDAPDLSVDRKKEVIAALGQFQTGAAVPALIQALEDRESGVRAAAVEALGSVLASIQESADEAPSVRSQAVNALAAFGLVEKRDPDEALQALRAKLGDRSAGVQKRAVQALGKLKDRESIPALIAAVDRAETHGEAVVALTEWPDPVALPVYLRALTDKSPDLRKRAAAAIGAIRDQVAPTLHQLAQRGELPPETLPGLREAFESIQPIMKWSLIGPFSMEAAPPFPVDQPIDPGATFPGEGNQTAAWRTVETQDPRGAIDPGPFYSNDEGLAVFGAVEIDSPDAREATMAVGSDDTLTVWVNGEQVYDFADRRAHSSQRDRFPVRLKAGANRVVIRCGNAGGPWAFSVAVSGSLDLAFLKAPAADRFAPEAYRAEALKGGGDPARGRALFDDPNGLACLKCHVVKGEGGAVGPDLSSVGAKYPREELITSVLFPSEKISSGYEPIILALDDGRVVTGVLKSESDEFIEIQDADAQTIRLDKAQVEDRKRSEVSIMPPGLAEGLAPADFADLIAYLESLREELEE